MKQLVIVFVMLMLCLVACAKKTSNVPPPIQFGEVFKGVNK